jgi:hypothetical protein
MILQRIMDRFFPAQDQPVRNLDNSRPPKYLVMPDNQILANCPGCDTIGRLSPMQFSGHLSMKCDCGYHETHDLRNTMGVRTWDELIAD